MPRPRRGRRTRTLPRARLAGRTPGRGRDRAGQTAPEERHAGAVRRLLQLPGRPPLPAGTTRLLARNCSTHPYTRNSLIINAFLTRQFRLAGSVDSVTE